MVCGIILGMVFARIGLPRVAAYTLVGVIFSPPLLGEDAGVVVGRWTEPVAEAALAVIAYLIGSAIRLEELREKGWMIFASALGGVLGAALMVFVAIILYEPSIPGISTMTLALALAAIATSTAPAATFAVIHQYRAQGPVSSTLLEVTALDDALGVIMFAFMLILVADISIADGMGVAMQEIGGAILLGLVAGSVLASVGNHIQLDELLLPVEFGMILLIYGLAERWHVSPLLSVMAVGFGARLFARGDGERLFTSVEPLEEMIFVVLFTVAGTHFQPEIFLQYYPVILLYFLARLVGKVGGTMLGSVLGCAPRVVVQWLGLSMVPQAGVAIGFVLLLLHYPAFEQVGMVLVNIILAATILAELIGPVITHVALKRSGEVRNNG
jgi:Kef-type K+ transport system membrane component KefB